jgi:hypothetical protein
VLAATVLAVPAAAQVVAVPSGISVTLFDVRFEAEPPLARFRFVVPDIADGAVAFADVVEDMTFLCDAVVVPALAANGWSAGEVVISFSAEELPFGEAAPEITQYFQPYSVADGACIWEDF